MKNWRNILSVIEVIIMLICVIVLIIHFTNKKNPTSSENINENLNSNDGLLTESYFLEYLNKYIDELMFSGYVNSSSENYVEKPFDLVTPNIFNTLDSSNKLYLSLSYLSNANLSLTKDNVERKYNEYFNNKKINFTSVNDCASYTYDDESKTFTLTKECITNSEDSLMVYKKSYEKKGKTAEATLYIGLKTPDGIYTDLNKNNLYDTSDISSFSINEENYQNFSKYLITFKEKDDSLYYFSSLSKIN